MTFKELLNARLNAIENALCEGKTSDSYHNELNGRANMFVKNGWYSEQARRAFYAVLVAEQDAEEGTEDTDSALIAFDSIDKAREEVEELI